MLFQQIARLVRVNVSFSLVSDGKYGSFVTETGWDGMIGELVRAEADVAIAPIAPTTERERLVLFSKPFMNAPLTFIRKRADKSHG